MANRLILDTSKFRISKPGFDVLTTDTKNLIFDSDKPSFQIVQYGSAVLNTYRGVNGVPGTRDGYYADITIPNQGFNPIFLWGWPHGVTPFYSLGSTTFYEYKSFTQIRLHNATIDGGIGGAYYEKLCYIVTNQRMVG